MIRKLGLDRMLQGRTGVGKRVCHLIARSRDGDQSFQAMVIANST
jgi:hypothetical protein